MALVKLALAGALLSWHALFYLGLLSVACVLAWLDQHHGRDWLSRCRLFFYPLAMNLVYFHLGVALPLLAPASFDGLLQRVDAFAFGGQGDFFLQPLYHPLLTDWLALCYSLFIPYLLVAFVSYGMRDLALMKRVYKGVFTVYGIGFICYLLVPAEGPYMFGMSPFEHDGAAGSLSVWIHQIIRDGSNHMDVFPSLHCAVTLYLMLMDREYAPKRFLFLWFPVANLWLSTVYLGYHYLIDVVCGMSLAFFVYALYSPAWKPARVTAD